MTIDERLEKLAELQEALTQTVEIIAGMQRAAEARMERVEEYMVKLDESMVKLHETMKKLTGTMNRLPTIVIRHEDRLDAIDGGNE